MVGRFWFGVGVGVRVRVVAPKIIRGRCSSFHEGQREKASTKAFMEGMARSVPALESEYVGKVTSLELLHLTLTLSILFDMKHAFLYVWIHLQLSEGKQ